MQKNGIFLCGANVWIGFLILSSICILYSLAVGPVGLWPDSLYHASLAKHVLATAVPTTPAGMPQATPPLYGLFMLVPLAVGNLVSGQNMLVVFQSLLYCTGFFPLYALLKIDERQKETESLILAATLLLCPAMLTFGAMLSSDMLAATLTLWVTYFYVRWSREGGWGKAFLISLFIVLLLMAHTLALAVWVACVCSAFFTKRNKKETWLIVFLPLFFYVLWIWGTGQDIGAFLQINFNNPLARFNFIKNGLFYLIYAGAPLAGLSLVVGATSRGTTLLKDNLLLLCCLASVAILLFSAFNASVIVEKKLDYFTSRSFDPFFVFPFLFLMRLEETQRREILSNGILILVVMFVFGFPHNLRLDFSSGLSYWAQGVPNPHMGLLRNLVLLLLLTLPVSMLFWKPRYFVPVYVCVALVIGAGSLMQNYMNWTRNEDGNMRFMNVALLHNHPEMKDIPVYADFDCKAQNNNDVAYLFRCFDVGRALYFLPRNPILRSSEEMSRAPLEDNKNAIFISSESDTLLGPTVAQLGLARFQKTDALSAEKVKGTPVVSIRKIEGLKRYYNIPLGGKYERMAFLGDKTVFHFQANHAGCGRIEMLLSGAEDELELSFSFNDKPVRRMKTGLLKGVQPFTLMQVEVNFVAGDSKLDMSVLNNKPQAGEEPAPEARTVLYNRPVILPCKQ